MTVTLRIIGFHNCDGCSRKVRIALRRIGVQLVKLDRENGNVTISTAEDPEVIRHALERQIKKSIMILSQDLVPVNQNPNSLIVSRDQVPATRALDLQEIGQVVYRLAQVLDGVEITNSNTTRINFIHRVNPPVVMPQHGGYISVQIRDDGVEYEPQRPPPRSPPWPATEPSAPPMPVEERKVVYGYPPDYYGASRPREHDDSNGCCNIF